MANRSLAVILLAIILIVLGMVAVLKLTFDALPIILGVMEILDGILFLLGR